jgi:hypothetical protein
MAVSLPRTTTTNPTQKDTDMTNVMVSRQVLAHATQEAELAYNIAVRTVSKAVDALDAAQSSLEEATRVYEALVAIMAVV